MKIKLATIMLLMMGICAFSGCGSSDGGGGNSGNGDSVINIATITGVTAPVIGVTKVTTITETAQFTGTVTWDGRLDRTSNIRRFKSVYCDHYADSKSGFTLTGVAANFFTVAGATFSNLANSGVITAVFPATATVSVGDATLGGKVAYILQPGDPGYVSDEQRGLIAAVDDQGAVWWQFGELTAVPDGTGFALGTGSVNTDKIIAHYGAGSGYAAGRARAYNCGGYNDWYLPSMRELKILHLNRDEIGNFTHDEYWSSTQAPMDANNAFILSFINSGNEMGKLKNNDCYVRPVRSF